MNADPKLIKSRVLIAYTSDDKYSMSTEMKTGKGSHNPSTGQPFPPENALLDGIEELARICALFGFEDQARAGVEGAFARVRAHQQLRKHG